MVFYTGRSAWTGKILSEFLGQEGARTNATTRAQWLGIRQEEVFHRRRRPVHLGVVGSMETI